MVAAAIMAIVFAIAYPSWHESVRKARRAEGRAALTQLMLQQERYYSQNTSYIAFSSASTDAGEKMFKWFSGDSAAASSYEISASACAGETIQNCALLTARPGTEKVNAGYKDSACGNLTLSSSGEKKASGSASNCWQ
jgi:type IV pilus assembly protein PilE